MLARLEHGRWAHARGQRTPLDDLELRLRETAAFCDGRAVVELRNVELALLPESRWAAVEDLVRERRAELAMPPSSGWEAAARLFTGRASARSRRPHEAPPGKMLLYFPDMDLCDGAAELASDGFFDAHNAPPPGTWVGYFDHGLDAGDPWSGGSLLAWVPEALVSRVAAGVEVNPEECIRWLDDTPVELRRVLGDTRLAPWLG